MTRDLAFQILTNFQNGEMVTERQLEKAAQVLQIDPKDILLEARFKTAATKVIKSFDKTAKLSKEGLDYFSASCGFTTDQVIKVAALSDTTPEDVVFTYLHYNNFTPHQKLAEDPSMQGAPNDAGLQQDPNLLSQFNIEPHQLMSQDPFGNPLVQPSASAPAQVPPMSGGNAQQLLDNYQNKDEIEQQQLDLSNQQMLAQEGQQPGSYSKEQIQQALMQADPMGKAQYIMPGGTEDQLSRLATEIEKVESLAGLPISDPGQLQKVQKAIEKQDKAKIDAAIQQVAESANPAQGGAGNGGTGPLPPPGQNPHLPQAGQGSQQVQGQQPQSSPPGNLAGQQEDMQKLAKKIVWIR